MENKHMTAKARRFIEDERADFIRHIENYIPDPQIPDDTLVKVYVHAFDHGYDEGEKACASKMSTSCASDKDTKDCSFSDKTDSILRHAVDNLEEFIVEGDLATTDKIRLLDYLSTVHSYGFESGYTEGVRKPSTLAGEDINAVYMRTISLNKRVSSLEATLKEQSKFIDTLMDKSAPVDGINIPLKTRLTNHDNMDAPSKISGTVTGGNLDKPANGVNTPQDPDRKSSPISTENGPKRHFHQILVGSSMDQKKLIKRCDHAIKLGYGNISITPYEFDKHGDIANWAVFIKTPIGMTWHDLIQELNRMWEAEEEPT
jgi:hypothetical protein